MKPNPAFYNLDSSGAYRYNPRCQVCHNYISVLRLSNLCRSCEEARKVKRKAEKKQYLSGIDAGLIVVLKRRITQSMQRSFNRERNIEKGHLTITYMLGLYDKQGGRCALSGRNLSLGTIIQGKYEPNVLSLDRIDPTKGYIEGNIQLTTSQANMAKGQCTNKGFLDFCKDVVAEAERNPMKFE